MNNQFDDVSAKAEDVGRGEIITCNLCSHGTQNNLKITKVDISSENGPQGPKSNFFVCTKKNAKGSSVQI
ncbi:unnamed protein product [Prunus armeniaca]|uniref:Uncharacterized protein n=1 Tax=Prunus armeniaca TaxID=36596 RepID=A0A6J5VQD0_PRUAR|nr:unnamed protein product [Prunus armeniaca]